MPAKIISFINMKGGVAKSTLLVNVADFLSRREGRRVLIIDVDPQFNATQMLISPQNYIRHLQDGRNTILDVFDRSRRIVSSVVGGAVETTRASLDD
ncbi:ParA family protein, partial [Deinococcus wulumuqiensis]